MRTKTFLYAAIGPALTCHLLDSDGARLTKGDSLRLPAAVQYAVAHKSGRTLYVASSDGAPGLGIAGSIHRLEAFRIEPRTGALTPHGAPRVLPSRPIHVSADPASRHLLVAYSVPAAVEIYRTAPDETLGSLVGQLAAITLGRFLHHVHVTPDGCRAILVCRGHDATTEQPEQPGSLNVFSFDDGQLHDQQVVAPQGGYGFGPRDVDCHPAKPWLYVSQERQNELAMFAWSADGALEAEPRLRVSTLAAARPDVHQLAGLVRVHPNGRFVYVANRAPEIRGPGHRPAFTGGDNTIAVYAIDPESGEPQLIQHVDTAGIHCRCFQIDASGRLLIAAHITALKVREGAFERLVPAGISIFRIADDGRLTLARRHEEDVGDDLLFWMGLVAVPGEQSMSA
ncbi:lactonase family protein [Chelatococcus sp. GCM10030263]|uniref:lactonase family protein n=1 Tax=Chelatococcus sp. GCM10030263 TaxID=3273387 RepID=UPI0036067819